MMRGGEKMELIVFTNNGQTYHFHYVKDFKPTTTGFSFSYVGKATGVERNAVFNNTSTAGYALAEAKKEVTENIAFYDGEIKNSQ